MSVVVTYIFGSGVGVMFVTLVHQNESFVIKGVKVYHTSYRRTLNLRRTESHSNSYSIQLS